MILIKKTDLLHALQWNNLSQFLSFVLNMCESLGLLYKESTRKIYYTYGSCYVNIMLTLYVTYNNP